MSEMTNSRHQTLHPFNILDTTPGESFDRITRMASQVLDLPVAAISLADKDRLWFKSRVGMDLREIPRHRSPCSAVSGLARPRVIENLTQSPEYRHSLLTEMGLRFYAGVPLLTRDNETLGTLCVMGYLPRSASEREIQTLEDLSKMVMSQIELQHAFGRVETITGLPNQSRFREDLQELEGESPGKGHFAIFIELVEVTQLNTLNRVMGPAYVDMLTREGGLKLHSLCQSGDRLYCIGPCQYLYLHRGDRDTRIRQYAGDLNKALTAMNQRGTLPLSLRPALGIAPFRAGSHSGCHILRIAHGACQDARNRDRVSAIHSRRLDVGHQRRFTLLRDMRKALERPGELELVFQPRVALDQGRCVGAEALLRWQHPRLGAITPSEFIPLIEHTPLAESLTRWVLKTAISQAATWRRQGLSLRLSVNIMASNLEEKGFTDRLLSWLDHSQVPREALELELTETALISHQKRVRRQLQVLNQAGIPIAIDDFGTGYSSLSYLLKIPAQVVKIDRTFTMEYQEEARRVILLRALVGLAHDMGYTTVAEGFAPATMLQTLQQIGCDEVQSFDIARPLSADRFTGWLEEFSQYKGPLPERLQA